MIDDDLIAAALAEENAANGGSSSSSSKYVGQVALADMVAEAPTLRLSFKNIKKIDNLHGFQVTTGCGARRLERLASARARAHCRHRSLSHRRAIVSHRPPPRPTKSLAMQRHGKDAWCARSRAVTTGTVVCTAHGVTWRRAPGACALAAGCVRCVGCVG